MDAAEIGKKVDLILSQARGLIEFEAQNGALAKLPLAADSRGFNHGQAVRESSQQFEPISEQLDLLKVLFSSLPEASRSYFWDAMAVTFNRDTAPVMAHGIIDLHAINLLSSMGWWLTADATALEHFWHSVRSKTAIQSQMFTASDLEFFTNFATATAKARVEPKRHQHGMPSDVERLEQELIATKTVIERVHYLRLKHLLLTSENPELNTDKRELVSRAEILGFTKEIANALDDVDRRIRAASTPIDFKGCMDLLRSVFEKIVQESVARAEPKTGIPAPRAGQKGVSSFAPFKEYLVNAKLLSADESEVVQKLYNYMSNAGAHSLSTAPEQARVMKNTVIEWSLMILGRVQQFVGSMRQ